MWFEAVWGCSALAPGSPSRSDSEAERDGRTVTTDELLMEPARDCLRRCWLPGLLGMGSAAASLGALMLRAVRLLKCLRRSQG